MDLHAEEIFQVLHQSDMIEKGPARLPLDEQIEVTPISGFAACDGAEDADVPGAMQGGEAKHGLAHFTTQGVQGDHAPILQQNRWPMRPMAVEDWAYEGSLELRKAALMQSGAYLQQFMP